MSSTPIRVVGVVVSCAVAAIVSSYGVYQGYIDHGEPIIAMATEMMIQGQQIYPSLKSDLFTSNLYGPFLYLVNSVFMLMFGANVMTGKIAGFVAAIGAMALIFCAYRKDRFPPSIRWYALIAMTGFILLNIPYSIWIRPDPFLVLLTALGVFLIRRAESVDGRFDGSSWLIPILIGGLGGVAVGFKIYAAAYIFPFAVLYFLGTKSFLSILLMAVTGLSVTFAPFALDVFSLGGFLEWFSLITQKSATFEMFERAMRYSVFFLVPSVAFLCLRLHEMFNSRASYIDSEMGYATATLLGLSVCISLASKPGAGAYYVLPFAPIVIDMLVRWMQFSGKIGISGRWVAGIIAAILLVTSIPVQKRFYRALHWDHAAAVQNDLSEIMDNHLGRSIQMGVGSNLEGYKNAIYKAALVFNGHPYTIDFGIMMETSLLQVRIADAVIDGMRHCRTDIWLIPKDEEPMKMVGYYNTVVVDDRLRNAFLANYLRINQSMFFDVWACRHSQ